MIMSANPPSPMKATRGKMPHSRALSTLPNALYSTQDTLRQLQDILRRGVAAETILWTFNTRDWVTGIQGADIDADGDIEIIVGSHDGYIRALTRWGVIKWERLFEKHAIS